MFFNTPYFVIDQDELDLNFDKLKKSLEKYWDNYIIGYSYKTNALPWIIRYLKKKGCYSEVVSEDEYNLAKLIGTKLNNIIYNGPIKSKDTFIEAVLGGAIVNIDSAREIAWLDEILPIEAKLGIRINFDIEKMCPGQSQCPDEGGRFGFCYENGEFEKALKAIQSKGFKITSLHLHTSSKSRGLDIYRAIANFACKIALEYDLNLRYIDIGGGFFGGLSDKPQFDDYFSMVSDILSTTFDKTSTTLIIEPGMAIIGSPISYVTSVIDVKDTTYNRFVVTDGSRTNIDPLMNKSNYFKEIVSDAGRNDVLPKQIICGYTCMEHDRLFALERDKALNVGDKIIYKKVGAYTMCLTPLFIKYFPDVYVKKGNVYTKVRDKWTPEEYVQNAIGDKDEYFNSERRDEK